MNTHDKINELLTAFALGELSPQESSDVETHLAECPRCTTELEEFRAVLECADATSRLSADEQACESAKQRILEAAASEQTTKPPVALESIWRTIMTTKRLKLAAAAVIVLAALALVHFLPNDSVRITAATFAEVIQNVIEAESISFQSRSKLGIGPAVVFKMYLQGQRMRGDMVALEGDQKGMDQLQKDMKERKLTALMSYIADFESKDGIELDHFRKTYKKLSIDDRMAAEFAGKNPIEQFRNVKPEDAKLLRTDSEDSRKIDVFLVKHVDLMGIKAELSGKEGERMTVWVDRVSRLPVRILLEASAHVEGKSRDSIEFYNFAWNEPIAQDTFLLKPPEGYTLNSKPIFPK